LKKLRLGAISFDHLHQFGWVRAALDLPMVDLVAAAEPVADQRGAARRALPEGVALVDAPAELLARDDIDAVTICSANVFHREQTEAALRAGKHVLLEKPMATNVADATALLELAAATNRVLIPAYPCRFDPRAADAKRRVEAGQIGTVLAMHATNHLQKTPAGWFVDPDLSGGGTIMDHIVHGIDLMRWIGAREVAEIYAEMGTRARPELRVDDVAMLLTTFEGGVVGSCDPSWDRPLRSTNWGDVSLRILGSEGALEFDLTGQFLTRTLETGAAAGVRKVQFGDSMNELLMREFAEAVLADRTPAVTDRDGWRGVACIEAAYESARTHRAVKVAGLPGD
jgi:predicted dehydrogenase